MYAIVKTGGKQYKVAPGDKINIEKLPAEVGDKITLDAICIVDGKTVESDPAKAKGTKVEAVVLDQFKDKKQLVFKFKKRKNYKKLRGHRQNLTRVQIMAVGSDKYTAPKKTAAKKVEKKDTEAKAETKAAAKTTAKAAETKAAKAEPKTASKATKASSTKAGSKTASTKAKTTKAAADKEAKATKPAAKKTAAKKAAKEDKSEE